jgi:hypothetical protein
VVAASNGSWREGNLAGSVHQATDQHPSQRQARLLVFAVIKVAQFTNDRSTPRPLSAAFRPRYMTG